MELSFGPARGDFARCGLCRAEGPIRALGTGAEAVPALRRCEGCDARYHERCLDELGRCGTPGCPDPVRSPRATTLAPPPAPSPKAAPEAAKPAAADPAYEARARRLAEAREAAATHGPGLDASLLRMGAIVGACAGGGAASLFVHGVAGPLPALGAGLLGACFGALLGHWFMWTPDSPEGGSRWHWFEP